jgi:hypothetical protein
MIIPVLTGLDTMATADAFCCIEENASRFAIIQFARWDEVAVLLTKNLRGTFAHAASLADRFLTPDVYHFLLATVNYGGENGR